MRIVYIAEPMDQAGGKTSECAGALFTHLSNLKDTAAYRPRTACYAGNASHADPRIEVMNRTVLDNVDALVAVVPAGVPSIGVPREIEAMVQAGKPYGVLTNLTNSMSLADADFHGTLDGDGVVAAGRWVESLLARPSADPRTPLQFTKDSYDGDLPTRAYPGDAGLDLYAAQEVYIAAGQFADVPCGVRVALPDGIWARIVSRSSTIRRRGLLVVEGTIDNGWRGPLFAGVQNLSGKSAIISRGERVAQLVLLPNVTPLFSPQWISSAEFSDIPHDGRGDNGFGSSGA